MAAITRTAFYSLARRTAVFVVLAMVSAALLALPYLVSGD
jgi:hypothetical protein